MTLAWRNSMSVGVAEFDKDHQCMLLLLQEIEAVVAAGDAAHAHALTVNLLALAGDHTSREEAFLRRIGFPGLDTWIAAKKDTLSRIAALKHAIPGGGPDLIASMEDALITYLLRADINFKSFVEAAGYRCDHWFRLLSKRVYRREHWPAAVC